ncbi:hypothetical protein K505DRAFT_151410 [Melanomma pulvis-pyrius CBS 109.77]|uniref:Uncharacterized protein n=1 Tax=Melanomma pulvis-pyrius CBS 109.77 TaxID=1314802 RepID=A0A6A6XLI7_9PLEO|nr:hypothetical protein K505DRAFT_151410 [Melanomma pulvis-pyrius CBS 109.77]
MRITFLTSVALLSGTALSTPLGIIERGERDLGFYMTTDPEWGYGHQTGERLHDWTSDPGCVSLEGTPFDKSISSFGPDEGVKCTVYDETDCTGEELVIFHPGYAEMGWDGWDDRISSLNCSACFIGVDGCW